MCAQHSSSKTEQVIIVHAGFTGGFTDGSGFTFKSKAKTGDYHDHMNPAYLQKVGQKENSAHIHFLSLTMCGLS